MVKMCHIELMILSQNDVSVQYLVFARVVFSQFGSVIIYPFA